MLSRHLVLALAAAGAVGLPALLSSGPRTEQQPVPATEEKSPLPNPAPQEPNSAADSSRKESPAKGEEKQTARPGPSSQPSSPSAIALEEVFRPDITPRWVMARWKQISTVTDQLRLSGYRVALVTGTRPDDLVGSLTYYFDSQDRLRRIRFRGTTGDPARLLALLAYRFQLRRVSGNAPEQVYRRTWNGRVVSQVRIWPSAVLDARRPQERFQVELVLEPSPQRHWLAPAKASPPELRL